MFLDRVGGMPGRTCSDDPSHYILRCLDYLDHIDIYHLFDPDVPHVRMPEFNPTAAGVYSGYAPWVERPGGSGSPWATGGWISIFETHRLRFRRLGGGRGMRAQSIPRTAREGRSPSRPAHPVTEHAFPDGSLLAEPNAAGQSPDARARLEPSQNEEEAMAEATGERIPALGMVGGGIRRLHRQRAPHPPGSTATTTWSRGALCRPGKARKSGRALSASPEDRLRQTRFRGDGGSEAAPRRNQAVAIVTPNPCTAPQREFLARGIHDLRQPPTATWRRPRRWPRISVRPMRSSCSPTVPPAIRRSGRRDGCDGLLG